MPNVKLEILTPDDGSPTVISLEDKFVKIIGPQSIIGRSIVVHANEDGCGRGGLELSLVNGNTGNAISLLCNWNLYCFLRREREKIE